ncbi:MAG: hypothetical protein K2M69_00430 [Muribaculaceae bacterium]|nr:hypothetical protein [Muribaculaceae bacterium]
MKSAEKLKICNWSLLVSGILILASSIQLEATGSEGIFPIWLHVALGIIFSALVFTHVYLHFKWNNWFKRFQKLKKPVTRLLWYLFLLTLALGIAAFVHWTTTYDHSPLGGVHGKIGFLMMAVAIAHTIKRIKFFKSSKR